MLWRPQRAAAMLVVPVPANGSNTVSPTKLNIRTRRSANCNGNGAGCCLVDAPVIPVRICWNHALWFSSEMTLNTRVQTSGCRYPPGFRSMRMNSMSFLITEFGS